MIPPWSRGVGITARNMPEKLSFSCKAGLALVRNEIIPFQRAELLSFLLESSFHARSALLTLVRSADYKSTEGLAKPEQCEGFGADRVLGHEGSPTDVGDEENSHGWLFSDASHRERSELGEISTLDFAYLAPLP